MFRLRIAMAFPQRAAVPGISPFSSFLFLPVYSSLCVICFCQIYHSVFRKPWRLHSSLSWRVTLSYYFF